MRSVLTRATAAIDRGVSRIMQSQMAPRETPAASRDLRLELIEQATFYNDGTLGTPSRFFRAPEAPEVTLTPVGEGPYGTHVVDLTYTTGYQPFHPAAREAYLAHRENQTAHVRWWTGGGGRPTIVLIHGLAGGNHWMTARTFVADYWLKHGYNVCSFQLPHHGARISAEHGKVRSSALFLSPNPLRMNEAFGHAIYDLRALAMFLRSRGCEHVGVMGMSLGGYTTALWASTAGTGEVGGVDFAVAMIPAVSFGQLMWSSNVDSPQRRRAVKDGVTQDLLVDAFAVHSPLTREPRIPRDSRFVIAGRGDRITGPEQAEILARHWDRDVMWFDGGHLAQIGRGDALRSVRRALDALGMANKKRA
jgi:pimeloyl-ACP methyl ester carboxylesterase